jgi:hypothetical protein
MSSLSATSPSSCGRGLGTSDLSASWVPSLMKKNADGTSSVVESDQTEVVYYRRAGGGRGPGVQPFPVGLRMIAGNAKATSDQSLPVVQWDCGVRPGRPARPRDPARRSGGFTAAGEVRRARGRSSSSRCRTSSGGGGPVGRRLAFFHVTGGSRRADLDPPSRRPG